VFHYIEKLIYKSWLQILFSVWTTRRRTQVHLITTGEGQNCLVIYLTFLGPTCNGLLVSLGRGLSSMTIWACQSIILTLHFLLCFFSIPTCITFFLLSIHRIRDHPYASCSNVLTIALHVMQSMLLLDKIILHYYNVHLELDITLWYRCHLHI